MAIQHPNPSIMTDEIVGKTIRGIEFVDVKGPDTGYVVIYLDGMRLYADAPSLCNDDSGDMPAAF